MSRTDPSALDAVLMLTLETRMDRFRDGSTAPQESVVCVIAALWILNVHVPPAKVPVPNVTHMVVSDALTELHNKNLKGQVNTIIGLPPFNIVISRSPTPGQLVNPGTTVTLSVHRP
jgi:hypothetical protein